MRSLCIWSVLVALAPAQGAGVELLWVNPAAAGPARFHDAVVLQEVGGAQRPFVQARAPTPIAGGGPLSTSDVANRPVHVDIGGMPWLYLLDGDSGMLYRGTDWNGSGALDAAECQGLWDLAAQGGAGPDGLFHRNGAFLVANDEGTGTRGVWRLEDLTGDGDFRDPGESVQIVAGGSAGSTMVVQGVTVSSDDVDAAAFLANDDVILYEDDDRILYRWDAATGQVTTWLRYQSLGNTGSLPGNPDFGGPLPPVTGGVGLISVDYSSLPETVYLAVEETASEPLVLAACDGNGDGDVNDAGEVDLFHDGTTSSPPTGDNRDVFWFSGSLYLAERRITPAGPRVGFHELRDLDGNGTIGGPGEQTTLQILPAGDEPPITALTVVPAGTFGAPGSCIGMALDHNGLTTAGGTVTFTVSDVPAANQGTGCQAYVAVSLDLAPGTFPLPGGCVLGLVPDALTWSLLALEPGSFLTPPITGPAATTAGFTAPPGLSQGLTFSAAALLIGPGALVTSPARWITVR